MKIISTVEELSEIYAGGLSQASVAKVTKALTPLYRQMIEASPFMALATVGPEGLDALRAVTSAALSGSSTTRRSICPTGAATTASIPS